MTGNLTGIVHANLSRCLGLTAALFFPKVQVSNYISFHVEVYFPIPMYFIDS